MEQNIFIMLLRKTLKKIKLTLCVISLEEGSKKQIFRKKVSKSDREKIPKCIDDLRSSFSKEYFLKHYELFKSQYSP